MSAENWIWHPDSLGMTTLVVTITLDILCIAIVAIRSCTRFRTGLFALDDFLMLVALGIFSACCGFTCLGVFTGLGTKDAHGLGAWNSSQTTKVSINPFDIIPVAMVG